MQRSPTIVHHCNEVGPLTKTTKTLDAGLRRQGEIKLNVDWANHREAQQVSTNVMKLDHWQKPPRHWISTIAGKRTFGRIKLIDDEAI